MRSDHGSVLAAEFQHGRLGAVGQRMEVLCVAGLRQLQEGRRLRWQFEESRGGKWSKFPRRQVPGNGRWVGGDCGGAIHIVGRWRRPDSGRGTMVAARSAARESGGAGWRWWCVPGVDGDAGWGR